HRLLRWCCQHLRWWVFGVVRARQAGVVQAANGTTSDMAWDYASCGPRHICCSSSGANLLGACARTAAEPTTSPLCATRGVGPFQPTHGPCGTRRTDGPAHCRATHCQPGEYSGGPGRHFEHAGASLVAGAGTHSDADNPSYDGGAPAEPGPRGHALAVGAGAQRERLHLHERKRTDTVRGRVRGGSRRGLLSSKLSCAMYVSGSEETITEKLTGEPAERHKYPPLGGASP
ncbi:unnamed protein product, partial [Ectocarpus fasciculatus]